jgi:hypothetical protein
MGKANSPELAIMPTARVLRGLPTLETLAGAQCINRLSTGDVLATIESEKNE